MYVYTNSRDPMLEELPLVVEYEESRETVTVICEGLPSSE